MFATPLPILGSPQCLPELTRADKEGHVCQVRMHDLGLSLSPGVLMLYFKTGSEPTRVIIYIFSHRVGSGIGERKARLAEHGVWLP